ncbi:MAG: NAD-dependent epimerase [Prevotella sp.]|nr:NAD-dependent epimerase [Prevotella sp.]
MNILVTGAAGFIGSHVMKALAEKGYSVIGIDNINDYYDPRLKYARLAQCGIDAHEANWESNIVSSTTLSDCKFIRMDIGDREKMNRLFQRYHFDKVVNLAAQAGVRYSISNPYSYMRSNLDGFLNILECCRHYGVKHLIFASSSSVYGMNTKVPFSEEDKIDTPVSLYAASKKSDELMAHCYSKLYGLQTTGLRYFTVYGPWGRPDMAPMLFAKSILAHEPIKVFNHGDMLRDFTYIDDIVEGTLRIIMLDGLQSPQGVPYSIFNIGCSKPVKLMDFISEMESSLGHEAEKVFLDMQPGDVYQTYADVTKLTEATGYSPKTQLHDGIRRFAEWYKTTYTDLMSRPTDTDEHI